MFETGVRMRVGEKAHFEIKAPTGAKVERDASRDEHLGPAVKVIVETGSRGRSGWLVAKELGDSAFKFDSGDDSVLVYVSVEAVGASDDFPSLGPGRVLTRPPVKGEDAPLVTAVISVPIRDEQSSTGTGGLMNIG